jgi:flagellar capping protein FliD
VSDNDTVASLVDKINNSGGALSASYDESSKTLNIQSTDPETRDKILIGGPNDSSNLFELLNVLENKTTQLEVGESGKPAIVVVDGREIESNTNEIKVAIEGVVL